MIITKFSEFINEARVEKSKLMDTLLKLFKDKPLIKLSSKSFPDEKGAYSLSGIKKYFRDNELTNDNADSALHTLESDKSKKLESIKIKNYYYNESYPYYYMNLNKDEIEDIKSKVEKEGSEKSKPAFKGETKNIRTTERKTPKKRTTKKK